MMRIAISLLCGGLMACAPIYLPQADSGPVDAASESADAGSGTPSDGGTVDGGMVDGGMVDGGMVDGGMVDGGMVDGGMVDGGMVDGGMVDGGVDGGLTDAGQADASMSLDASSDDSGTADSGAELDGGSELDGGAELDAGALPDAGTSFILGGTVQGLDSGETLVLGTGSARRSIISNGSFQLTSLAAGQSYDVFVVTQPSGQSCAVEFGSGTDVMSDVMGVTVNCVNVFKIGGKLSGLATAPVVLVDTAGELSDEITVSEDGSFTFDDPLPEGSSYAVTVQIQPNGQACTVSNGTGSNITANVTGISVVCQDVYTIAGTLAGLAAHAEVVLGNGSDILPLMANSSFEIGSVTAGGGYDVVVASQPPGQVCTVANGIGTNVTSNVTDVAVVCTDVFTISGIVNGLDAAADGGTDGGSVVLVDTSGSLSDKLTVSTNGSFTFDVPLTLGSSYAVTVAAQPQGQVCAVSDGTGASIDINVMAVTVTCINVYTVGGTVSGLDGTLEIENGSDTLSLTFDGPFQLPTPVPAGGSYDVVIVSQPATQLCSIVHAAGTDVVQPIDDVGISCVNAYSIGGSVSGLVGTVILSNSTMGADDLVTVTLNGSFKFGTSVGQGSTYDVTVQGQPAGQSCAVSEGTGTVGASDVTGVMVSCGDVYTIGGTVSGLEEGGLLVLENGTSDAEVSSNGAFELSAPSAAGSDYDITVVFQPNGQECTVANGAGTNLMADVTGIVVTCVDVFTVGGSVSGLIGTLLLGDASTGINDTLPVTSNGAFTFDTAIPQGNSYAVTVKQQPNGQVCTVSDGTGSSIAAGVSDIVVSCVDVVQDAGVPDAGAIDAGTAEDASCPWPSDSEPQVVATGQSNPWNIISTAVGLYWINNSAAGSVVGVQPGATSPTVVSANEQHPYALTADSQNLYWVDNYSPGWVVSASLASGVVSTLVSGQSQPNGIAVSSSSVFWTNYGNGDVMALSLTTHAVTTLVSGLITPYTIAADDSAIFWIGSPAVGGSDVSQLTIGSSTPIQVSPGGESFLVGVAVSLSSVFWTSSQGGTIESAPIGGGATTTIAASQSAPEFIALDASFVYWANAGGYIARAPLGGGTVETLATGQSSPKGIAVDACGVYWTNTGDGTVMRLSPK